MTAQEMEVFRETLLLYRNFIFVANIFKELFYLPAFISQFKKLVNCFLRVCFYAANLNGIIFIHVRDSNILYYFRRYIYYITQIIITGNFL